MTVTEAQRQLWQKIWDQEERSLEKRRRRLESVALAISKALKTRWPAIYAIWQFGSSLGPGFQRDSDLDLAIGGLPAADLLDAFAVAEGTIDQQVAAGHLTPVAVDLVRLETLPPHWRERIRKRAARLL